MNIAILSPGLGTTAKYIMDNLTDHNYVLFPNKINNEHLMLCRMGLHDIDLIVLCGYTHKIGEKTIAQYDKRIINIHPSLLPKHGGKGMYGLHVHQSVIDSGDKQSGATVHYVNSEYDEGEIIAQCVIDVLDGDTAESLQIRVKELEKRLICGVISERS